ncbi:unnamed protein product [Rhodiola kirilowii]
MMKNDFVNITRGMDRRVELLREALCEAQRMQRANVKWLEEGDASTKYFYSILKGRRSRNNIKSVKCADGSVTTYHSSIKRELVCYFKDILAQTKECSSPKPEIINRGKKVDDSQCMGLVCEATNKEIWNALCKIGSDKSSGPDGFSVSFFKKNWNVVGREFCNGIRHCLKHNALPKGMNAAYISLIPKTSNAVEPGDFRPISYCNVTYKVLSGLLAERLKGVLPGIIDVAQGAFIQGRSIIVNVCMAQQLVSSYNQKNISESGLEN